MRLEGTTESSCKLIQERKSNELYKALAAVCFSASDTNPNEQSKKMFFGPTHDLT
jgi:hypothetical protein